MMKKLLLLITMLLPILSVGSHAQEKLFNEAIKNGITSKGCYYFQNTKHKGFQYYDVQGYASANGYIILGCTEETRVRFGNRVNLIDEVEFIDAKNYPYYVYSALSGSNADVERAQQSGIVFLTKSEKVYREVNVFVSVYDGVKTVFEHFDALWTGNVSNGYIDGPGVGFMTMPGGIYLRLEGTFSKGFPVSEVDVKYVTKTDMKNAAVKRDEIQSKKYEEIPIETFFSNLETSDPVLKKAVQMRTEEMYRNEVARVEAVYNKVKTLNMSNYRDFELDYSVLTFIKLYQSLNYDPSNVLPKAMEIKDLYYVVEALKMEIKSHYYGYSLWSLLTMFYDWLDKEEEQDRLLLDTGLEKARLGQESSKYGFAGFFSQAADVLYQKKQDFESKISSDMAEYSRMAKNEKAERAAREAELSKEIDGERSKDPSGELTSGLFDAYWYFENEGEIIFKSGSNYVKYNAFYYDRNGQDFSHFEITNASRSIENAMGSDRHKLFKTMSEMVNAILKACN